MLNNAYITVGIKDLWTKKANSIADSTDKMSKSLEAFNKKFISTTRNFDLFERKLSNTDRSLEKTQKKFNELHTLSPVNLSKLVNADFSKQINQINKVKKNIKDTSGGKSQQGTATGMIGGFVAGATGVSFLRSATRNATEFDTALYDINRQLGDDENIKDYIKFIDKYALKTGRARVEIAQQTAELRKTLKAGEGLKEIEDRIQLMTFATNQLEVDSVMSAKAIEIVGNAFNLSTEQMKAFFSQANQMEDFYGALVTGGDLLEIVGRMPITLMRNMKLMSKESTLMLATFAKANTNLDASAVGYNLGKALEGGRRARGGGIIAMAEKQGKTIEEYLFSIGEEFKNIQSVAGQNDFIELITGTNDMQAKDVFRSLLTEIGKVDKAKVASFQLVQKQFEEGKISSIQYRKEMEQLSSAEKTFVARFMKTEQALKDFNRTMQLLGDRHDATLGRISESWKMVSGAFGNQVLFPALNLLADGLERIAPTVTMLINDYPNLMKVLAGAGAVAGIVAIVNSFTMLRNALLGVALGLNTIAKSKAFWLLTAAGVAYDMISSKYNKFQESLTPEQRSKWSENEKKMKEQGLNPKQMNERREALKKEFNGQEAFRQGVFTPPMSGTQSRPTQGSIDIRLMTDDKTQAIVDVKKEDGTFLNILQPTKTRN